MRLSANLLFWLGAVLCFAIALLLLLGVFNGNAQPWEAGGLLSLTLALFPYYPSPPG